MMRTPTLVELVIKEEMGLHAAYKQALATKNTQETQEARIARLKRQAPDLYERVTERELSPQEADTLLERRDCERGCCARSVPGLRPGETARIWRSRRIAA